MEWAWKLFTGLPQGMQVVVILIDMGAIALVGLACFISKLRGPDGQAAMEQVIRETSDGLRADIRGVDRNLSDLRVTTAQHFGQLDAQMDSFNKKLDDHDLRGRELRRDVKEAINGNGRMI